MWRIRFFYGDWIIGAGETGAVLYVVCGSGVCGRIVAAHPIIAHKNTTPPIRVPSPLARRSSHKQKFETYSLPESSGKNPPLARACALAHAPLSTVLRLKTRDRKKARLNNDPQAVLALSSGNRHLILPPPYWTCPPYWWRGCDFEVLALKNAEETIISR